MHLFLSDKKAKTHHRLFVDVASGSVGVLLVVEKEGVVVTKMHARAGALFREKATRTRKAEGATHLLEKALTKLRTQYAQTGFSVPEQIFIFYSEPWARTQMVEVSEIQEKDFSFTMAHHVHLEEEARKKARHALSHEDSRPLRLLCERTLSSFVNGYKLPLSFGIRAQHISLTRIVSYVDEKFAEACEDTLRAFFSDANIFDASFSERLYTLFAERHPDLQASLVIAISEESTDVGLVECGTIRHVASFPCGVHSLVRSVAVAENTLPAEILSLLNMSTSGHRTEADAQRLITLFERVGGSWKEQFRRALESVNALTTGEISAYLVDSTPLTGLFSNLITQALSSRGDDEGVVGEGARVPVRLHILGAKEPDDRGREERRGKKVRSAPLHRKRALSTLTEHPSPPSYDVRLDLLSSKVSVMSE